MLTSILDLALLAAPWLVFGLLVAGVVKGLVPEHRIQQWLSGQGFRPILRGAMLGLPLPMCSCGAIPTALSLHRGGAGRGPTTSFLVGTPGAGLDSLSITLALMGPFMMVARGVGAVFAAVTTGLLTTLGPDAPTPETQQASSCDSGCCNAGCGSAPTLTPPPGLREGLRYAFVDMLDDISVWIVIGLAAAGILMTLAPPEGLAALGTGIGAMLLMAVIGIPLYLCAAATTPIAAALMLEGLTPGTAMVLMLAGPVTSLATLSIVRNEMGTAVLGLYLAGITLSTVAVGLITDWTIATLELDILASVSAVREWVPASVKWIALIALVVLGIPALRGNLIARRTPDECCN